MALDAEGHYISNGDIGFYLYFFQILIVQSPCRASMVQSNERCDGKMFKGVCKDVNTMPHVKEQIDNENTRQLTGFI